MCRVSDGPVAGFDHPQVAPGAESRILAGVPTERIAGSRAIEAKWR
jgi:hypothetical protein